MKSKIKQISALLVAIFITAFVFFACKNNVDTSYTITVSESEHGTVTASASSAVAGSTVTLTVTAESDYTLDKLTVTDASGNTVSTAEVTSGTEYTFTMPSSDVNVQATFTDILYTITVSESEHGTVTASASSAMAGSIITLTVEDERGSNYVLDTLTVKDENGNSVPTTEVQLDYEYTFIMPKSYVEISATFVELYIVTFDSMGGSDVPSARVKHGHTISKPDDPTKNGYVFLYWSDNASTEFDFSSNAISDNITLYAEWIQEGFVKVYGRIFDGTTTLTPESQVFISGRRLEIGDLYVCDHEVTQAEYEIYCKYGGSSSPSETYGKGDNFPVYYVSWYDAIVYCNLRSLAEGFNPVYSLSGGTDPSEWEDVVSEVDESGMNKYCGPSSTNSNWNSVNFDKSANGYRLPTEAEWEYLARGGHTNSFTYSGSDTADEVAWFNNNSGNKTHEVKTKTANSLGIYDMSGNVWEWCYDWYTASITTSTSEPVDTPESSIYHRVRRGGAWDGSTYAVSNRSGYDLYDRLKGFGFRVVRNAY